MQCFIFSGLGADQRVFDEIDFGNYHPQFIPWKSVDPDESLSSYAMKMSANFPKKEPFLLIGISFGGILAQEVGKYFPQAKILLLSSVQQRKELPLWMRFFSIFLSEKVIPIRRILKFNRINYSFFGTKTELERQRLSEILNDTDPKFAQFAIGCILRWKKTPIDNSIVHIHGDNDSIFPIKRVKPDHIISGGSHFMTVSKAAILSPIIQQCLHTLELDN